MERIIKTMSINKKSEMFSLDNTLRNILQYLSVQVKLVAVELYFRGIKYRADTPEEAVRLREVLEKSDADTPDRLADGAGLAAQFVRVRHADHSPFSGAEDVEQSWAQPRD